MSPVIIRILRVLEIVFWFITATLTALSVAMTGYQLNVLFLPYWWHCIAGSPGKFPFPPYFYRVYGDDVSGLNYEHYGYLVSIIMVTGLVCYGVLPNHPWRCYQTEEPTVIKSKKIE